MRFSLANCLDAPLLARTLTAQSQLARSGKSFYGGWSWDIDDKKLGNLIGIDREAVRKARLVELLEHISRVPICAQHFRICPDCIDLGYHSIYFQILALDQCPVHRSPLTTRCPHCHSLLPFFGICSDLLASPYFCCSCGASYGSSVVRLPGFFADLTMKERYAEAWRPMDRWQEAILGAPYSFSSLRDWAMWQLPGESAERSVKVIRGLSTIAELPGQYSWAWPDVNFRRVHVPSASLLDRDICADTESCVGAYQQTLRTIEAVFIKRGPHALCRSLRAEDRRVLSPKILDVLTPEELAYVFWRMHFEQKACPALLQAESRVGRVLVSAGSAPASWRDTSKRLWLLIFRACYASLLMDIKLTQAEGRQLADYDRLPVNRNYVLLPRNELKENAGGIYIFPMLQRPRKRRDSRGPRRLARAH